MNTGQTQAELTITVDAYPRVGMTLSELEQKMKELGNKVLRRDDARGCLVMIVEKAK